MSRAVWCIYSKLISHNYTLWTTKSIYARRVQATAAVCGLFYMSTYRVACITADHPLPRSDCYKNQLLYPNNGRWEDATSGLRINV